MTAVFGAILLGFAAWCVTVVLDVSRLRGELELRVGWLGALQPVQSQLSDAEASLVDVERQLHETDLEIIAHGTSSESLSGELAIALVELRAVQSGAIDGTRRAAVAASVGRAVAELRRETGELSVRLGSRWTALLSIAISAIVTSAGLLALLGHRLLVVGPRMRRDAERLTQLSLRVQQSTATVRGVGHDLGGPLTSALTTLQVLRDDLRGAGESRDEHLRMLAEAISALSRAAGTIQDLRASSDSGEEPTSDVHAALDEALAATRFKGGDSSKVTIDAERVALAALPAAVVRRLFTQILEGSGRGARPIAVRTRQEQTLIAVEFAVPTADIGAFERVSRALDVLGGSLRVRAEGDGELVRVELPMCTPVPAGAAVAGPVQRGRILLVDDDPIVLSSVARVLANYDVTSATDPDVAIELAIAGEFDLVLCDMVMPGKTGMQVFEAIVAARPELAARFVVMSGGSIDLETSVALGRAPAKIDKPFGAQELRAVVARYVAASGTGRGTGTGTEEGLKNALRSCGPS